MAGCLTDGLRKVMSTTPLSHIEKKSFSATLTRSYFSLTKTGFELMHCIKWPSVDD